jgi:hypothetical protein
MLRAGLAEYRERLAYPLAQGMKQGDGTAGEDDAFHEFM